MNTFEWVESITIIVLTVTAIGLFAARYANADYITALQGRLDAAYDRQHQLLQEVGGAERRNKALTDAVSGLSKENEALRQKIRTARNLHASNRKKLKKRSR